MSTVYSTLVEDVKKLESGFHKLTYQIDGKAINIALNLEKKSDKLVILFHGSVDLEKRELPVFALPPKRLLGQASFLSIADPLITKDMGCRTTWYAGCDRFDTQSIVLKIIKSFSSALNANRCVYYGSSSGGFAALYFSFHHPGSVVISSNPQVKIIHYHPGAVKNYMSSCWPSLIERNMLESSTCADLIKLYASGFKNSVIYVQNSSDHLHFDRFAIPFSNAIKKSLVKNRFVLHSDYFGRLGHAASAHADSIWLESALSSTEISADGLNQMKWELDSSYKRILAMRDRENASNKGVFSTNDLAIAEKLRILNENKRLGSLNVKSI